MTLVTSWLQLFIALIAALTPVLIVLLSRRSARKVEEIHVLVNARLDAALSQAP